MLSRSRSPARPRSTRSSFHARFAASRRPEHSPWPRNGGVRWAASPTSSTCPLRIWLASMERNSYTALRVSGPSSGPYHGSSSDHTLSGSSKSEGCSSGQQHELPAPMPGTALHDRRRALGIAPLARDRQVRERPHVVGLGVDHQPALLEAEIAAGDPGGLAHERVGAVGTNQPSSPHRPGVARQRRPARLLLLVNGAPEASARRPHRGQPAPWLPIRARRSRSAGRTRAGRSRAPALAGRTCSPSPSPTAPGRASRTA